MCTFCSFQKNSFLILCSGKGSAILMFPSASVRQAVHFAIFLIEFFCCKIHTYSVPRARVFGIEVAASCRGCVGTRNVGTDHSDSATTTLRRSPYKFIASDVKSRLPLMKIPNENDIRCWRISSYLRRAHFDHYQIGLVPEFDRLQDLQRRRKQNMHHFPFRHRHRLREQATSSHFHHY